MPGTTIRYARGAAQILRASAGRLDVPFKLNLCVTYWCQYRCKTCNIWQRQPSDELSTDEILEFVRRNRDFGWLDLTGGEIFLRPDIGDLLEAIARTWTRLAILHFPTNGFLTSRIVDVVSRLAPTIDASLVVTVSVDGDEALNDEVRGIRGGYRNQIATFNALRKIPGVHVVFGMTLSSYNVGRLQATFEACRRDCPDLRIEDFHVNVAQVSDHYYGNAGDGGLQAPREPVRDEIRRYRALRGLPTSLAAMLEGAYLSRLDRFLVTGRTPMRCHALRSTCFVDPWGVVFPCITYSRPLGRLRETAMDLAPIWNSAEVGSVQREIWEGQCPQCWTACEAYPSILGNLARGLR